MTDDTIEACPACDSASIRRRYRTAHRYYCSACGERFDEPTERERQHPAGSSVGGLSPAGLAALRYGQERES